MTGSNVGEPIDLTAYAVITGSYSNTSTFGFDLPKGYEIEFTHGFTGPGSIPEPGAIALLAAGALMLLKRSIN